METVGLALRVSVVHKQSDTKYRDIADGNGKARSAKPHPIEESDTKYRDIADGNVAD